MEVLKFYTKPDCHLCDRVREVLDEVGADWDEINIQTDPELMERYRNDIPVIQSGRGIWSYKDWNTIPLEHWLRRCGSW